MILLVNQHTVPIFIDIVNAFAASRNDVVLMTGHVEQGRVPVSPNVRIIRGTRYERRTSFSRLLSWLKFSLHYCWVLLTNRPSRVVAVTNPPFVPLITSWLCRLKKVPYHVLVYDLYPDALVQAKLVTKNSFIFRLWARMNLSMFRHAKSIFTLSNSMKEALLPYASASENNIVIIHNWADTEYITPVERDKNPFIKRNDLFNKFVVLYSGNMGLTHDLESIVDAAALLKKHKDIVFLFIGDGGKKDMLLRKVNDMQLSSVYFMPYQDSQSFPFAMAAADVGVVTLGEGAEGISVPSKTYINMAAGLAIVTIAPEKSELNRIIKSFDAGIVCAPRKATEVAEAIERLYSDVALLKAYKTNSRKASLHFTPSLASEYVKAVLA